jgi:Transposase DDE domain
VAELRTPRLKERLAALRDRLRALQAMETLVEAAPDRQISLTDPDARAMATNGKGTGLVGYNVQAAVDTKHHLVVAHEVTNVGHDRTQLASIAGQAHAATGEAAIHVLADRGYFSGEEILACEQAGISVTLPKPLTSGAKAEGRFSKQDFVYQENEDAYRCPAGQMLTYRFESIEKGMTLRRYWTSACSTCSIKADCTPSVQRRITRWEHEHVLEVVQRRLDENPNAMRDRRQTVEHVFGTLKAWMGATHFLTKGMRHVAGEMSLQVLAYNMKRVIAILGAAPLIAAIRG